MNAPISKLINIETQKGSNIKDLIKVKNSPWLAAPSTYNELKVKNTNIRMEKK